MNTDLENSAESIFPVMDADLTNLVTSFAGHERLMFHWDKAIIMRGNFIWIFTMKYR